MSNVKKIYAGTSDEGLTEKGVIQAKQVADKLKNYKIHSLYTSPVKRAFETAIIIGKVIDKESIVDTAFREMKMGPWEGLSESEVAQMYYEDWNTWNNRPAELRLPGRETLAELRDRVLKGIRGISRETINHNVVIVTHVAIIRVLVLWHSGRSLNLYKTIHVPNAEIFEINIS